jgi:hypothetical protein
MKTYIKLIISALMITFNVCGQTVKINDVVLTADNKNIRLEYLSDKVSDERIILVVKLDEIKTKNEFLIDEIIGKEIHDGFLYINSVVNDNYYWGVESGDYLLVVITKKNGLAVINKKILKIDKKNIK